MAVLYSWLKFIHVLSVGTFLFVHGVAGGAGFLLILLILISGIWMTFAGNWGHRVWPWAALAILVFPLGIMGAIARPYYLAREAAGGPDDALATRLANTRPQLAAAVGVVALVLIFALMVFKPF